MVHGNRGVVGVAFVGDVVAGDFVGLGADEQEGVGAVGVDFDEDFVAGAEGVRRAGVGEVEAMEMDGGGLAVVEDGLVGEADLVDVAKDPSGHASAEAAGDVIGKDEAEDVVGAVNA